MTSTGSVRAIFQTQKASANKTRPIGERTQYVNGAGESLLHYGEGNAIEKVTPQWVRSENPGNALVVDPAWQRALVCVIDSLSES